MGRPTSPTPGESGRWPCPHPGPHLPPSLRGCFVHQDLPLNSRSIFSLLQLFIPFCYLDIAASKLTPTKIPTAQNIPGHPDSRP